MSSKNSLEKSKTHGKGNKNYRSKPVLTSCPRLAHSHGNDASFSAVLCARYVAGHCQYDDDCWFIHDPQGLVSPPYLPLKVEAEATMIPEKKSTPERTISKPTPLGDRVKMHPCYKSEFLLPALH